MDIIITIKNRRISNRNSWNELRMFRQKNACKSYSFMLSLRPKCSVRVFGPCLLRKHTVTSCCARTEPVFSLQAGSVAVAFDECVWLWCEPKIGIIKSFILNTLSVQCHLLWKVFWFNFELLGGTSIHIAIALLILLRPSNRTNYLLTILSTVKEFASGVLVANQNAPESVQITLSHSALTPNEITWNMNSPTRSQKFWNYVSTANEEFDEIRFVWMQYFALNANQQTTMWHKVMTNIGSIKLYFVGAKERNENEEEQTAMSRTDTKERLMHEDEIYFCVRKRALAWNRSNNNRQEKYILIKSFQ